MVQRGYQFPIVHDDLSARTADRRHDFFIVFFEVLAPCALKARRKRKGLAAAGIGADIAARFAFAAARNPLFGEGARGDRLRFQRFLLKARRHFPRYDMHKVILDFKLHHSSLAVIDGDYLSAFLKMLLLNPYGKVEHIHIRFRQRYQVQPVGNIRDQIQLRHGINLPFPLRKIMREKQYGKS